MELGLSSAFMIRIFSYFGVIPELGSSCPLSRINAATATAYLIHIPIMIHDRPQGSTKRVATDVIDSQNRLSVILMKAPSEAIVLLCAA